MYHTMMTRKRPPVKATRGGGLNKGAISDLMRSRELYQMLSEIISGVVRELDNNRIRFPMKVACL